MTEPDAEWAKERLRDFIALTHPSPTSTGTFRSAAPTETVLASQDVIEKILDRYFPRWRYEVPANKFDRWRRHHEAARRCLAQIEQQAEVDEKLGSSGPRLSSTAMHPWVWEAAKPQWGSGHLAEAVSAATRSINSRLQQKLGRRDVSELKLVREAFTLNAPTPTANRLRVMEDDGSDTYKSLHEGILSFGSGCFQAIRNPLAHLNPGEVEITEQEALERLAALSLFARWVDDAVVVEHDGGTG